MYRPNTYAFSDDLTIVRGNHQWAVGASVALNDWKTRSNVRSGGPFSFNGGVTGLGLADFMLGRVFEYRQATPFLQDITQKYFGVYAQDTWKASPNVTLNYGLRWEPWFPQQHQQSRLQLRHRSVPGGTTQQGVPAGAAADSRIRATRASRTRPGMSASG